MFRKSRIKIVASITLVLVLLLSSTLCIIYFTSYIDVYRKDQIICIALSIRQAAESANEKNLSSMSVTATISFDRTAAMSNMSEGGQNFDKSFFKDKMGSFSSLSLEEYQTYAQAEAVKDFYFSTTFYVNGSEDFEPVSTEADEEETNSTEQPQMMPNDNPMRGTDSQGGMQGKDSKIFGQNSDFSVVAYSGENAMTSFINGSASISSGEIFSTDGANESSFSMFGSTSSDPANAVYINYDTAQDIFEKSKDVFLADTESDSDGGSDDKGSFLNPMEKNETAKTYISKVSSAMNMTVVSQ